MARTALLLVAFVAACSWPWDERDPRLHDDAASPGDGAAPPCSTASDCPRWDHATIDCLRGHCNMTCVTGYDDCDDRLADGCEVELATDPMYCGSCNNACTHGQSCTDGNCR